MTGRLAGLLVVIALVVVTLAIPVRSWFAQRAQIAALEADVQAKQARVDDLRVQVERWQDPAFIASEARKRLHFVVPGEVGYVVLGVDGKPIQTDPTQATPDIPWYSKIWNGLTEADDASDAATTQ